MPKNEFDYYIALCSDNNTLSYVTDVNYETKQFPCKAGTKALKFGKKKAEDLLYLMTCNNFPAVIIVKISGSTCPRNPKEQI